MHISIKMYLQVQQNDASILTFKPKAQSLFMEEHVCLLQAQESHFGPAPDRGYSLSLSETLLRR